jgi:hypothetical protein
VLQMIVRGLAEDCEVALTRIWLTAPGDICTSCHMRSVCPEQTRCLHLAASAGSPLPEKEQPEGSQENWNRTDGHFRRTPSSSPRMIVHMGAAGLYCSWAADQGFRITLRDHYPPLNDPCRQGAIE